MGFINIKKAAEIIGISVASINRLLTKGEIPSYKIGDRRVFDLEELVSWVRSKRDPKYKGKGKR